MDRWAEAWDAARGWVLFAGMVAVLGAVAGLAGSVAGNFQTVGILLGCAVVCFVVAVALRGLLRWGIEENLSAAVKNHDATPVTHAFRRAA